MGRHRIKQLITTQAAKNTGHEDFRQLAVGQMVRLLIARRQLKQAERIVANYEKSVGKNQFTAKLRTNIKPPGGLSIES